MHYICLMIGETIEKAKAQMRKGVLELCILAIIAGEDEVYPSDILNKLKEAELIVKEGTLYPLLSRLKDAGFLGYTWKESDQGPPRKYFHISSDGRLFLRGLTRTWQELVQAVEKSIQNNQRDE